MGAVLALLASLSWGTGDFLAGTLSRRAHPVAVMRLSQVIGLAALAVAAVVTGELGASGYLVWGVLGGFAGLIGLGSFYAALAQGTMGVVAPVAATGVVVPVAVGLVQGETPSALQAVGIVVAVVGVIMASGPERGASDADRHAARRPLLLAGVAALGFGAVLALVAEGSEHSVVMTLATMRVVNVTVGSILLATVFRGATSPTRSDLPAVAVIGGTDTGANALYAIATGTSLVSVSAVLASLYPAVTAVLAWRFHGERLTRIQRSGVAITLVGVALLAAG